MTNDYALGDLQMIALSCAYSWSKNAAIIPREIKMKYLANHDSQSYLLTR
jgi:hypothetical protein